MMFMIGLFLIIPIAVIFFQSQSPRLKRITGLVDALVVIVSILYVALCLILREGPFAFDLYLANYVFAAIGIVFVFSPFLWIVVLYFCSKIYKNTRIRRNAKIKSDRQYQYNRDDLDKISPNIVMFTSMLDVDIRRSIASTVLKLKLSGFIQEHNGELQHTGKNDAELLMSEKMVLNSIKSLYFDDKQYKRAIEEETWDNNYIRKNKGNRVQKVIKILITLSIPVIMFISAFMLNNYSHENYPIVWFADSSVRYLRILDRRDLQNLIYNENPDPSHFRQRYMASTGRYSINQTLIRADRLEYGIVRYKAMLDITGGLLFVGSFMAVFVSIFLTQKQIRHFNYSYIRTTKGVKLVNEAYALTNFLKDFTDIKNRVDDEVALWEYYLIYAVALGVNVTAGDEIMDKYVNTTWLSRIDYFIQHSNNNNIS